MTRQELLAQVCGLIQVVQELNCVADTTDCICHPTTKGEGRYNESSMEYLTYAICDTLAKNFAKDEIKESFDNFGITDYGYCKPDPTL